MRRRDTRSPKMMMLIVLLIPYLINLMTAFPLTTVAAVLPEGQQILDSDRLAVTVDHELQDDQILWSIHYETYILDEEETRFKFRLSEEAQLLEDDVFHLEDGWLTEPNFSGADRQTLQVITPIAQTTLQLELQLDQRTYQLASPMLATEQTDAFETAASEFDEAAEELLEENILLPAEAGPHLITADVPEIKEEIEEEPGEEESAEEGLEAEIIEEETEEEAVADSHEEVPQQETEEAGEETNDSELTLSPQQQIVPKAAETSGSLIISDQAFNDPADLRISVTGNALGYQRYDVGYGGTLYDYNNWSQTQNGIYKNYLTGSGKAAIIFEENAAQASMANTVISVYYPHVGYIEGDGSLRPISASITISNILRAPRPTTVNQRGYHDERVSIDFATNLYSGILLTGISAADWQFVFTYSDTDEVVNFDTTYNPYITFNSLNGYGQNNAQGEFVRAIDDRNGSSIGATSAITKTTVTTPNNFTFPLSFENVYTSTGNFSEGTDDFLGSPTFNRGSVQFPLNGAANSFQIGTGGAAGRRGWFTFSSAAIVPVRHTKPIKTVQPVNQYQEGDNWMQPSGSETGWAQRFWNDLDRYYDGSASLDMPVYYRVDGHDADKPNELAPGVPLKSERYVLDGQEHYYFINQPTINLVSEGLVQPSGYKITDSLPEGVSLANGAASFTLYDLQGNILEDYAIEITDDTFTVTLSEANVKLINAQSNTAGYYGKDFSLRVKVVVENAIEDELDDLMVNTATTTFTYSTGQVYEQTSNKVHTRVKTAAVDFSLTKKITGTDQPLAAAQFALFEDEESTVPLSTSTISDESGKIAFAQVMPGEYVLKEIQTPAGFITMAPVAVTIHADGSITGLPEQGNLYNTLKAVTLTLNKTGTDGALLTGARFVLVDSQGDRIELTEMQGVHSVKGLQAGRYQLEESEAPAGYQAVGVIGTLVIESDGGILFENNEGHENSPTVDSTGDVIAVSLGAIVNEWKPFELVIHKISSADQTPLENAVFELFAEADTALEQPLAKLTTTKTGLGSFITPDGTLFELTAGTYIVKETAAPDGYAAKRGTFKIVIDTAGGVTASYEGEPVEDVSVTHTKGDTAHNLIQFTAVNTPKGQLPSTGGRGRQAFTWISLALFGLTALTGMYYTARKRKQTEKKRSSRKFFIGLLLLPTLFGGLANAVSAEAASDTIQLVLHKRIFRDIDYPADYSYQNSGLLLAEDDPDAPEIVTGATALNRANFRIYDVTDYYSGLQLDARSFVEYFSSMEPAAARKLAEEQRFLEVAGSPIQTSTHEEYGRGVATIELPRFTADGRYAVYLVLEDDVEPAVDFNIDIEQFSRPLALLLPIMDPSATDKELDIIHIYPKNIGYYRDPYFFKYGEVTGNPDSEVPLEGVVFAMYQLAASGEKLYLDMDSRNDLGNSWVFSQDPLTDENVTKFTSDEDGLVATIGRFFASGTYYFEELESVAGYEITEADRAIEVVIPDSWYDDAGNIRYVTVNGQQMLELPSGQIPAEAYEKAEPRVVNYRSELEKDPVEATKPPTNPNAPSRPGGFLPQTGEAKAAISLVGLLLVLSAAVIWKKKRKENQ